MDDFEYAERRSAFNLWFTLHADALGYHKLPPRLQGITHDMLRRAFNAGQRFEQRKNEPIKVGGRD